MRDDLGFSVSLVSVMHERPANLKSASDEALVVASILGDFPAFDELVRRYRDAVELTAYRLLGNRTLAQEVAQDAFLLAFEHLPRLDDAQAFPGWLRAIVRNRALRVRASEGKALNLTDAQLALLEASPNLQADLATERKLALAGLLALIDGLPSVQREALLLRAKDGWSVSRIALYQDVTEATVRGRLQRARAALTGRLAREEY